MKKLISHAWFAGGVKEFDTETGAVTASSDQEWGATGFGSIWRQNGEYFAFYRDDTSLLLQHKTHKWRVIPEFTVSLQGFHIFRNFKVMHREKEVFSIWYKPKGLVFCLIDPTYDEIDAESDDFFLYVKTMWTLWAGRPYSEFISEFGAKNV